MEPDESTGGSGYRRWAAALVGAAAVVALVVVVLLIRDGQTTDNAVDGVVYYGDSEEYSDHSNGHEEGGWCDGIAPAERVEEHTARFERARLIHEDPEPPFELVVSGSSVSGAANTGDDTHHWHVPFSLGEVCESDCDRPLTGSNGA